MVPTIDFIIEAWAAATPSFCLASPKSATFGMGTNGVKTNGAAF